MNIKEMYSDAKDISIETYLKKCGVENVEEYLASSYVEPLINYDNIYECAKGLLDNLSDKLYLLVDCDFDGYMSASMTYVFFKQLKPNLKITPIFHNAKEHGLDDSDVINYLKSVEPSIIYVTDAGTNDANKCKTLSNLGWKIFISDHHKKTKDNPYAIIVNNQVGNVENKALSGCGVTWKVLSAIDELNNTSYSMDLISYVWLANIGDSMNFNTCENQTFRFWGSKCIHTNLLPFIEEFNRDMDISNKGCSFGLISKINALIRVGEKEDKEKLFSALCGELQYNDIFKRCKSLHSKQNSKKDKLLDDIEIITDKNVVLAKIKDKTTLTGLIANKLATIYNKPILLLHDKDDGEVAGSMRVPSSMSVMKQLKECGLFNYLEGHEFACGVSYQKDKETEIINYLDNILTVQKPYIDVLISSITKTIPTSLFWLYNDNKMLFGKGIEIPKVHFQQIEIHSSSIKELGANKTTLKFTKDGIDFIIFFANEETKNKLFMNKDTSFYIECICELSVNKYFNRNYLQAEITQFETTEIKIKTLKDAFKGR